MADFPQVKPKSLLGRAYEIINRPRGGETTDDEDISLRQIMRAIETEYAATLKEDMDERLANGLGINSQLGIPYDCLKLEDAKESCDCGTIKCGLKKVKIPTFAQYGGRPAIFFFGTEEVTFQYASNLQEARTIATSKPFRPAKPAYYIAGSYAMVVLPSEYSEICIVSITGIPQNPSDTDAECFDIWSEEYPMLEYLWSKTKARVMGGEIQDMIQGERFKDVTNNAMSGNQQLQAK